MSATPTNPASAASDFQPGDYVVIQRSASDVPVWRQAIGQVRFVDASNRYALVIPQAISPFDVRCKLDDLVLLDQAEGRSLWSRGIDNLAQTRKTTKRRNRS